MRKIFALLLIVAIFIVGCANEGESAERNYPVSVNGVTFEEAPSGVVSLSPVVTEILKELDLVDSLVAVSDFCDVEELPKAGSYLTPNFDAIYESGADTVIVSASLKVSDLDRFAQMGIDVVLIPHAINLGQTKTLYTDIATILTGSVDGAFKGENLYTNFIQKLEYLYREVSGIEQPLPSAENTEDGAEESEEETDKEWEPIVSFDYQKTALVLLSEDLNVATGGSIEEDILQYIAVDNAAGGYSDYFVPSEEFAALSYDILLISDEIDFESFSQTESYLSLAREGVSVVFFSPEKFIYQSSLSFDEALKVAKEIYPDKF